MKGQEAPCLPGFRVENDIVCELLYSLIDHCCADAEGAGLGAGVVLETGYLSFEDRLAEIEDDEAAGESEADHKERM